MSWQSAKPLSIAQPAPESEVDDMKDFAEFMANYHKWSVGDVLNWLQLIGFGDYGPTFKHNNIDGYDLVRINCNDLQDIGLERRIARQLFREIAALMSVEFTKKTSSRRNTQSPPSPSPSLRLSRTASTESTNNLPLDTSLTRTHSLDSKSKKSLFKGLFGRK